MVKFKDGNYSCYFVFVSQSNPKKSDFKNKEAIFYPVKMQNTSHVFYS